MIEEKIHKGVLHKQYTLLEVNSRKGHDTRLKRWYWYCRDRGFLDLHPYPATRVHNYLEVDLDRMLLRATRGSIATCKTH